MALKTKAPETFLTGIGYPAMMSPPWLSQAQIVLSESSFAYGFEVVCLYILIYAHEDNVKLLCEKVEIQPVVWYVNPVETKRKKFNTTLRADLIKKLKVLAIETDVNVNDLLEDAIEAFLKKYNKKTQKPR